MASDCDNDSIVIEDSIRQNFYTFMDKVAYQIFDQVFNQWASKILEAGLSNIKQG
jgi:preprotein translocase subunit SecF